MSATTYTRTVRDGNTVLYVDVWGVCWMFPMGDEPVGGWMERLDEHGDLRPVTFMSEVTALKWLEEECKAGRVSSPEFATIQRMPRVRNGESW